jgi:hypothetical protein
MAAKDEMERMCKEEVVAYFKVLTQHLHGKTQKNHKKSGQPRFGMFQDQAGVPTSRRHTYVRSVNIA